MAADRESEPGLGLVAVGGQAVGDQVAAGLAGRRRHAPRGGHRGLVDRVGVVGRLHTGHAGVCGKRGPLELQRQAHLVLGREIDQLGAVQVEGCGLHAVGLGHSRELVDAAEAGVVQCFIEGLSQRLVVEGGGVGEALPAVAYDSHADPHRRRRGERLDLALVGPHLGLALLGDEGLHIEARASPANNPLSNLQQALTHRSNRLIWNWQQNARHPCKTLPIPNRPPPRHRTGSRTHATRAKRCQFPTGPHPGTELATGSA